MVTAELGPQETPEGKYADTLACQRALVGAQLALQMRQDAASVCDLADGTRVRLRGWVSEQRMDLTLPLHAEILED